MPAKSLAEPSVTTADLTQLLSTCKKASSLSWAHRVGLACSGDRPSWLKVGRRKHAAPSQLVFPFFLEGSQNFLPDRNIQYMQGIAQGTVPRLGSLPAQRHGHCCRHKLSRLAASKTSAPASVASVELGNNGGVWLQGVSLDFAANVTLRCNQCGPADAAALRS